MKVDLVREEVPFDEFFKIFKGTLRFEQFDGSMSKEVKRYSFEKSDAVAVLVYHQDKDEYILVKQFRYPPVHHGIDPWLIEIVAGGKEENETDEESAMREVEEETGYQPLYLEKISKCYVSPGMMSERVTIFVAVVDETSKVNNGGGAQGEDEDIQLIYLPREEANQWMTDQQYGDAKTIIALLWHMREMEKN